MTFASRVFASAALMTAVSIAGPAQSMPVKLELDPLLSEPLPVSDGFAITDLELRSAETTVSGSITLDPALLAGPRPTVDDFVPIPVFDIDLELDFDPSSDLDELIAYDLLPSNSGLVLNRRVVGVDASGGQNRLFVDTTGVPAGTVILDVTRDRFPEGGMEFPNGRRFGDGDNDFLILQLFAGSVGLRVVAIEDGSAFFLNLAGQLSAGDGITLAAEAGAPGTTAVPLPATLPLLLGGCGLAGLALGRRRRG